MHHSPRAPLMPRRWPDRLWLVRHGQSAGNVLRDAADAAGHARIDIATRDMDVPLSELGERQSRALGHWFAEQPVAEQPTVVISSPYVRAVQTADFIRAGGGVSPHANLQIDERLREREFGVLDRLTTRGIREQFPDQYEARARLGKFYHRPPGGESWVDVVLRLRSLLDTVSLHHAEPGARVLIVAHQVVVLCLRYLVEQFTEAEILAIDRESDVANCGVTEYRLSTSAGHATDHSTDHSTDQRTDQRTDHVADDQATLTLERYNMVVPLEREGTPVTDAPDANVAPR